MKKLTALALCAVLLLWLLTACGRDNPATLRVAMSPDFSPMEFLDLSKNGQDRFVGFDVSLAKYLARGMNMKLEIVPMSLEACQDAVADGTVDLAISGFTWLPQRAERFNLSDTYHAGDNSARQVLLIREGEAAQFTTAGLRVGAQTASLQEWLVTQQMPDAEYIPFDDLNVGLEHLREGKIDALAVADGHADTILIAEASFSKAEFQFHLTEELLDNLILIKKGNDTLTESVNALLAQASAARYYPQWYAEALEQAGVGMELYYDPEGNLATEG